MIRLFQYINSICIFHKITGLYCPGCGGTRALYYLLTEHPVLSFIYHPLVIYIPFALFANAVFFVTNKKYHPKPIWLWMALIITLLNWAIKNIALLVGIDLLAIA